VAPDDERTVNGDATPPVKAPRRRRPRPGTPHASRPITLGGQRAVPKRRRWRVGAWTIALVAMIGLLAAGYLLLMRHVDPTAARQEILRELAAQRMEPGERVQLTAFIFQRSPWDYFRSSHGVLAATDRRLIALTIAPTDRFAREVERPVVQRREFPKDTSLHVTRGRTLFGLVPGLTLRAPGVRWTYAVPDDGRTQLTALLANVKQRQDSIHAAAAEAARQRARLAEYMRQPIWYRVRRGDAVTSIAQRFNTTPEYLREINGMENDRIRIGDSLMIKPPTP
jgi:hypothetical protein